jgi:PGF-CTERM protein
MVVLIALLMLVTSTVGEYLPRFEERWLPGNYDFNKTVLPFQHHLVDENNNDCGGFYGAFIMSGIDEEPYRVKIPDNAKIFEGYVERWHNVTGISYDADCTIICIVPSPMGRAYEYLWEKNIPCIDLNNIYPFSVNVSECYKDAGLLIHFRLNERDSCYKDTKQLAFNLIKATEVRISELKREKIDTSIIERLLAKAKSSYDSGDYVRAAKIATDAKSRADLTYHNEKSFIVGFGLFPPEIPKPTPTVTLVPLTPTPMPTPSPTATVTKIPAPEEKEVPGFEVIFAIMGLLAVAYLLRRRK